MPEKLNADQIENWRRLIPQYGVCSKQMAAGLSDDQIQGLRDEFQAMIDASTSKQHVNAGIYESLAVISNPPPDSESDDI